MPNPVPRSALIGLSLLTLATGLVDAASVLGLGHVFTANMTGNLVFLGFSLAHRGATSVAASLIALGSFALGALIGGRAMAGGRPLRPRAALGLAVAALATAAVVAAVAPAAPEAIPVQVALLALAMGLRTAIVRKLAVPDLTTTVLTLTVTGLAADSSLAGGANPNWQRRLTAVAMMLTGAALGALLLQQGMLAALAAAAGVEAAGSAWLARSGLLSTATAVPGGRR